MRRRSARRFPDGWRSASKTLKFFCARERELQFSLNFNIPRVFLQVLLQSDCRISGVELINGRVGLTYFTRLDAG